MRYRPSAFRASLVRPQGWSAFCIGGVLAAVAIVSIAACGVDPPMASKDGPSPAPASDRLTVSTTRPGPTIALRTPTAASPLRLLEIGDSLGIDLGDQLETELDSSGLVRTTMASTGDTGLANTSFYDWPRHLAALLSEFHPEIVVVFLGANDDQGLSTVDGATDPGNPDWEAGYGRRVDEVLDEATKAGARVVWVGMPPMADIGLNLAMEREDDIYQGQVSRYPGALYVPSNPVLGVASAPFQEAVVDGEGARVVARTPDGVHLTPEGATLLAGFVVAAIDRCWHLSLATPSTDLTTVTTGPRSG
jgi:hypothetical protein